MWLYWCLLSTIIGGFTAVALKKCSNNDPKRIALMGLLSYHLIMIAVSMITNPEFITKLNIVDMINMLPGILMQSIGFYCMISATKYGKVAITSSISKAKVVVTFLLGIIILKENCTLLQLFVSTILVILSIMVAKNKTDTKKQIDKKLEQKAIMYSYGFVLFNGISNFLNKIYVTEYQNPMYVVFNYAVIIIIGLFIYCLFTKNWNYLDIRKINAKKFFVLQALLDASSSIFNRFALLDGNVSIISVITASSIVVTILSSRFILKEKITYRKYLMILGIFICVLILSLIK
ncbi:MAG TPA: EamA family transporter [Clostridiaceae bacterium]|nr:EamA family transporter [Clostridiaceae bacterium]